MAIYKDRVKETTDVTGLGNPILNGAVTGYKAFSTVGNGASIYYAIQGRSTGEFEIGLGTYNLSSNTITRGGVTSSSNSDALVPFSAGTKDIFLTVPASQIPTAMDSATAQAGTSTTAQTVSASVLKAGIDANANVVKTYSSVSAIPSGFVGTARVGTDLYVGDGVNLKTQSPTPSYTFIPLGDSRVANGGVGNFTLARGWYNHLSAQMGGRLSILRNAGVSGQTSTQILARLTTDVISYKPNWCLIMCTVNDITLGVSLTAMQTNYQSMISQCLAAGIKVAISTIGPWGTYSTLASQIQHSQFNNWLKKYCAQNAILCIDEYAATATSTGYAAANMVYDGETTYGHYSDYGAYLVGVAWYKVMDKIIPPLDLLNHHGIDYGNMFWNASGKWTVGASFPANYSVQKSIAGTATGSVVARTDGKQGSLLQVTGTAGAGEQGQYIGLFADTYYLPAARVPSAFYSAGINRMLYNGNCYMCTSSGTIAATAPTYNTNIGDYTTDGGAVFVRTENFLDGDQVVFEVEYFTTGVSGGNGGFHVCAAFQANSGYEVRINFLSDNTTKVPLPTSGVLRSNVITYAAAASYYHPLIIAYMDASVTGTMQIGNISMRHT